MKLPSHCFSQAKTYARNSYRCKRTDQRHTHTLKCIFRWHSKYSTRAYGTCTFQMSHRMCACTHFVIELMYRNYLLFVFIMKSRSKKQKKKKTAAEIKNNKNYTDWHNNIFNKYLCVFSLTIFIVVVAGKVGWILCSLCNLLICCCFFGVSIPKAQRHSYVGSLAIWVACLCTLIPN